MKRWPRPVPQPRILPQFKKRVHQAEGFVLWIDGPYTGQPQCVRPDKPIPLFYNSGVLAYKQADMIVSDIIKELQKGCKKKLTVSFATHIGTAGFRQIVFHAGAHAVVKQQLFAWKKMKIDEPVIVLRRSDYKNNTFGIDDVRRLVKVNAQICVVDQHGRKRYPK